MRHWPTGIGACVPALLFAMPVLAGGLAPGDGSRVDNPDLLAAPGQPCSLCAPAAPAEAEAPLLDVDWSLGLRGSVSSDGEGGDPEYELIILPKATMRHDVVGGEYSIDVEGEIGVTDDGDVRIGRLNLEVSGRNALDEVTAIEGSASLSLSQDDPDDPLIASEPVVVSGRLEAGASRDLGLTTLSLRGSLGRVVNGETVYADDTTLDNSFDNTTTYGAGGRFGVRILPGVTTFLDGEATSETYDEPSPSLLVPLDNRTYAVRAGISSEHRELFSAEASIGYAVRDFTDESIDDVGAILYDASLTYRPDETLSLTGRLSTTLGPPGGTSGSSAELSHALTGEAEYLANSWLRLRGNVEWSEAELLGTAVRKRGWRAGVGADYLLNQHTDLTADYGFRREETTPEPAEDTHQVMLGVNFHR